MSMTMIRPAVFILLLYSALLYPIKAGSTLRNSNTNSEHEHPSHRKLIDTSGATSDVAISGQYIVILKSKMGVLSSSSDVRFKFQSLLESTTGGVGKVLHTFYHVFNGAVVSGIPRSSFINLLNQDDIEYATPNKKVNISAIQNDVVWGIDRIDQEDYPLSDSYRYNYTGKNVTVFVLDTGIKGTHAEFQVGKRSRVQCFYNAIAAESCTDLHGHGTHVAATVGGNSFGVAKEVELRTVKVLDQTGYGDDAGVILGVENVIAYKKKFPKSKMVINMSLGGDLNTALNTAVNTAVNNGIFVAVAAGNSYGNACQYSPSSATNVFTVGSISQPFLYSGDMKSFFSNSGPCVDIFAPGEEIISASLDCGTCSTSLSGTSMASPHVAGVAALYMQKYPTYTLTQIMNKIKSDALKDKISFLSSDTANLIVNVKV